MTDRAHPPQNGGPAPAAASGEEKPWGQKHRDIVEDEIRAINTRREKAREIDTATLEPDQVIDVVGLALSGGGIRSSAVCLGVLQALNLHNLIKRIDYLSTVSGGGYIGSSLSATATVTRQFVFGERPAGTVTAGEISDTPAVGHIRNYSNYLIPAGARDVATGIAIVVRGLVANLSLTLPVVLVIAAVTIWSTPLRSCLSVANFFGVGLADSKTCELHHFALVDGYTFTIIGAGLALLILLLSGIIYRTFRSDRGIGPSTMLVYLAGIVFLLGIACDFARFLEVKHFALTLATALLGLSLFFIWALKQSFAGPEHRQEFRGHWPTVGATYLVLLALVAFCEFQPFMLGGMFDVAEAGEAGGPFSVAVSWIKSLAAIAAPIAGVVTAFRQQFAELLKGNSVSSELGSTIIAVAARLAIWIAGAALPLIIWVGYLYLSYWGIANDTVAKCPAPPPAAVVNGCPLSSPANPPAGKNLSGKIQFDSGAGTLSAEIKPLTGSAEAGRELPTATSHAPNWLKSSAEWVAGRAGWSGAGLGYAFSLPMVILYAAAGVMLFALSWFLTPNANSLHRLYRDRLSKAFLFDPRRSADGRIGRLEESLDQGRDFRALDRMKLSELYPTVLREPAAPAHEEKGGEPERRLNAPYHLINTALNIQGSDFANRRGRNADFFVFSPLHVGSEATHYAKISEMESAEPSLDLATAMAISGAAASSNMGSNSIRALTPTLALLNVRLGYWLRNPRYVEASSTPRHSSTPLYLLSEISGRLYENSDAVYLTDGGHIENLGIFELLRRRCKVIIAVDAEADAPMNFSSLMTLQRYARIDLGIRIDLPWTPIRARTLELMDRNAGKPPAAPSASPGSAAPPPAPKDYAHVAIGTIDYGSKKTGYLVYIKSSLTGDENDYIRDYARRNGRFPHETTGDQFFSEEQFEVYRALGFHMVHGFLSGEHPVATGPGINSTPAKFTVGGVAAIDAIRTALGLRPADPPPAPGKSATSDQGSGGRADPGETPMSRT